jgi:hypothetical protein
MLLITIFMELHVVARRGRTRGGQVAHRPLMAILCCGLEKNAWSEHGKCESDTAALCKSNGKDTFYTLSSTVWQGKGMDAACYV